MRPDLPGDALSLGLLLPQVAAAPSLISVHLIEVHVLKTQIREETQ